MKRVILLTLSLSGLSPFQGTGWAQSVFYVDQTHPNASDSNPGTSESAPWRTLHRAVDGIPSREQGGGSGTFTPARAGDTVFVKNGTYVDITPAIDSDPTIKYNPSNSGTTSAPIAFRAYTPSSGPRHRPVVSRNLATIAAANNPVIGSSNRNYIIWDGFATAPRTEFAVSNNTGTIIENNLVDKTGVITPGFGNYDGIFVQGTIDVIVRNNIVRNVFFTNDLTSSNAACIVSYDNLRLRVHNNDLSSCNTGIFDKRNGVNNTHELNYFHDISFVALQISAFTASQCGTCPVDGITFRRNVVRNSPIGIRVQGGSNVGNLHFYNNTFYGGPGGRVGITIDPAINIPLLIYNNIIIRDTAPTSQARGHQVHAAGSGPPAGMLSNFNLYYGTTGPDALFTPMSFGPTETFAQWRTRGFDANSLTTDPLFVGPLSALGPAVFIPQAGSPAVNAGRVNGSSSGAPVNMGAYLTSSDVIGPGAAAAGAPTIPTGLRLTR